jgi:hypothetical protein
MSFIKNYSSFGSHWHTERHDLLEVGEIVATGASPWKVLPDAWQPSLGEHEGPHETKVRSVSACHQIFARNRLYKEVDSSSPWFVLVGRRKPSKTSFSVIQTNGWCTRGLDLKA